ncbi:MAG: flagellar export chaperone FliS [Deltaproteobacteria bacterium]|jgi:flagellar protein FliS|nr:flagellar export chaperone FliS [Deltaproteobacteria bacterium]
MKNAYQKYKTTSIQSAGREKLLLMMYEGAIKFTKLGIQAAEEKRIADRGMNIGRAYDIVMELNNTLDHSVGGDISKNLEQLYMYITELYTKGNISGSPEPLREALKLLETLYDGWQKAVEQLKKNQGEKVG